MSCCWGIGKMPKTEPMKDFFFFSSRRRHTRYWRDWSSDVCSSDLMPKEVNGNVSNSFLSVVSLFGNQRGDSTHAGRGGDLWLMTTNGGLVNLTRKAGFGTSGSQDGIGIGVRDPAVHWSGVKVIFSMVMGAP